jgi:membrane protease YdiL (CAAX protease family)
MSAASLPVATSTKVPVAISAIVKGLLVGLVAANVWPILLVSLGMPSAAIAEACFLALYLWWASGGGAPSSTKEARAAAFRRTSLTRAQWFWGMVAAVFFATSVHSALVVLFRIVPFPVDAFRQDYRGFSVVSPAFQWFAIVLAAASAGICEETGFRGYMQQPIEKRHGVVIAVLISSVLFTVVHLSKSWAIPGMVPVALAAGLLLGLMAWASGSLIPGMIGHTVMDIGMFGYWWTGIAGTFRATTISVTGIDRPFEFEIAIAAGALLLTLTAIARLRLLRTSA